MKERLKYKLSYPELMTRCARALARRESIIGVSMYCPTRLGVLLRQSASAARATLRRSTVIKDSGNDNRGFTLIELSVVMAIIALLLSFSLSAFSTVQDSQSAKLNREKIQMVYNAIEAYLEENGSIPCVANRLLPPTHPNFGESIIASNTPCPIGAVAGTVLIPNGGNPVRIGHVPVRDLGIPESLAYDAYGNRFTYVVTEDQTDPDTYAATAGEIIVKNIADLPVNTSGTISYTLISHGKSGAGAFNHKTAALTRACKTTAGDGKNCDDIDLIFTDIAQNTGTVLANFFDDKILWKLNPDAGVAPPVFNGFTGYKFQHPGCNPCNPITTDDALYDVGYPDPSTSVIQNWYQPGDNTHVTIPDGIDLIEITLEGTYQGGDSWWFTGCFIEDGTGAQVGQKLFQSQANNVFRFKTSVDLFASSSFSDRRVKVICYDAQQVTVEVKGVICEGCK